MTALCSGLPSPIFLRFSAVHAERGPHKPSSIPTSRAFRAALLRCVLTATRVGTSPFLTLDAMNSTVAPFFVTGCVRSGTTLLRLLLGHHPQICQCEEFDFSVELFGEHPGQPTPQELHEFLELHRGFRLSGYEIDKSLGVADLLRSFLQSRRATEGCELVGGAVHSQFHRLTDIWPDAKFIHIRRDPRDVSRSIVQMGWAGNAWAGTHRWVETERHWSMLEEKLQSDKYMEIGFEQLVEDPVRVLERVCDFLGVQYDSAMLEIDRDTTYKRPGRGTASSWQDNATIREVQLAEAGAGDYLVAAGYEPSSHPRLRVGAMRRRSLKLQDRLVRTRFAIDRYGLKLWLAGVFSRRLPFHGWRTEVELRAQEIMNQHMK